MTRQTINNLEKNNRDKFKLTKTQYIATRSVLDAEISHCPEETKTLRLILEMLVDHPEKYSAGEKKKMMDKVNLIVPSSGEGTATRLEASNAIVHSIETAVKVIQENRKIAEAGAKSAE